MDGEKHIMTVHVVTGQRLDSEIIRKIKYDVRRSIYNLKITHITIEVEGEEESENCVYNKDRC